MSRNTPSPVLLTSLLPINPAIKPNTIHAKIDIIYSPSFLPVRSVISNQGFRRPPPFAGRATLVSLICKTAFLSASEAVPPEHLVANTHQEEKRSGETRLLR